MIVDPWVFSKAVKRFWGTRSRQAAKQRKRGGSDQGARGAVTGGQQMNGFAETIVELMIAAGVDERDIYGIDKREIPGFYRPTKEWDLLVVSNGNLRAVLELKSQVGSFGNNFNNRSEEAIGTAVDVWIAFREGAFGTTAQPWLGYLFVLEDCPKSQSPVKVMEPHFKVFPEFRGASYAKRYEILLRKLVLERQYNSACLLLVDGNKAKVRENYREPAADLAATPFLEALLHHVGRTR